MAKNFHSAHAYLAFEKELKNIILVLTKNVISACGYSKDTIKSCLIQRLVAHSLGPYIQLLSRRIDQNIDIIPPPGTIIDCQILQLKIGSGVIKLTTGKKMLSLVEFFTHWGYNLLAIISGRIPKKECGPATLVFGTSSDNLFVDGSDHQFVKFCRFGSVSPLRQATRLIVQSYSEKGTFTDKAFSYVHQPISVLLRQVRLGFVNRIFLFLQHLLLPFHFIFSLIRFPLHALIARDFAYVRIISVMGREKAIEAIVDTCSSCPSQPLWAHTQHPFSTHMIWYAQNWRPIAYASDSKLSDIPNLRWIAMDNHWIWTEGFKEYLMNLLPEASFHVVGPLMWRLPEIKAINKGQIQITVFDISPFSNEFATSIGQMRNYNSPKHLFKFIEDILVLKKILENKFAFPVTIKLKQKRGNNLVYDQAYMEFIQQLGQEGKIIFLPWNTNIFSLIVSSHVSIVYPYSSPAYVANHLKRPAIYYDPTGELLPVYEKTKWVNFTQKPEDLQKFVIDLINQQQEVYQEM